MGQPPVAAAIAENGSTTGGRGEPHAEPARYGYWMPRVTDIGWRRSRICSFWVTDMWGRRLRICRCLRRGFWMPKLRVVEARICIGSGGFRRWVEWFVGFGLPLGCGVVLGRRRWADFGVRLVCFRKSASAVTCDDAHAFAAAFHLKGTSKIDALT